MVPIEELPIISLEARHLTDALALSEEAHWNQVASDWSMMGAAGKGIGVEDCQGRLIASALTLPYGAGFGWISMVLVTADWRQQGVATRLLQACMERLEDDGLVPVLDATPAGENVYHPLGFLPHFGFQRWQHDAVEEIPPNLALVAAVRKSGPADREKLVELDAAVFGSARPIVVENLIGRSGEFSCLTHDRTGFAVGRDGRNATQIGPITAQSSADAIAMLHHALKALRGPVFIDACDHQEEFVGRLEELGFCPQRPYLRMARRRAEHFGVPDKMFAMAGPELG